MDDRAELLPVLEAARARGARAAEVLRQRFERLESSGARVRPVRGQSERWTVRVWLDGGRAGEAWGSAKPGLVAAALAAAAAAPPAPFAGPADRMAPITGTLGIDDRRHAAIEESDRNELLHVAERALASGAVELRRLQYAEVRERRSWMSSREVELSSASTTYTLSATAALGEVVLGHRIASRKFSDVASLPFGTELRRRLEALARPIAGVPPAWPVLLDPRAVASLVRGLAAAFAAPAITANFLRDRLDRPLAASVLHLTDDAGLASGLHTRAFDDRGVPPIPVTLLKEGVPAGLYHDPESARAAGLRPTGHHLSGALVPSNLIVRPGSRTRNVIVGELGRYVQVDEFPPLDLRTGRIRGPARVAIFDACSRVSAGHTQLDIDVGALLHALEEVAADQERCEEVDAPTAVFSPLPWG